ncbi:MAG: hypothetical protein Q8R85_08235 [Bosea sp. (in: a-proteobacteria)]|uniref:hypothetical protein n=1 Tax=Bosea sp. (in: a-proteobacteria) TaxID=1871050 RepID=UPI00273391B3|nr:hypothetical protein [Bosea sp. (in: a-proteobacteria)]MDP3601134.1 hypothetical protein [Bosea sp. (in: a-proteobacteria)]
MTVIKAALAEEDAADRRWVAIAAEALQRVNFVSHGEKRAMLSDIAKERNLSENHVRRMMRSLTFTVEIEPRHREVARALRTVTFKVAELIDRWYRRDEKAAIDAAESYVSGRLSYRGLFAVYEGKTLEDRGSKQADGLDLPSYRDAALSKVRSMIGLDLEEAQRPDAMTLLSDVDHFLQEKKGSKRWAIMIVLPGLSSNLYRARRELDLGRALALHQLNVTPVFVLPDESAPREFERVLEAFHINFALVVSLGIRKSYG